MTHLKLQKLKGDYPTAHRINVNVLLSNITFLVIFAVLDVPFAINSCLPQGRPQRKQKCG